MTPALARLAVRRAAQAILLVWLSASAAFVLTRLAPGGYFDAIGADPAVRASERHRYGLDRPIGSQYVSWIAHALRLDLGESMKYRRPVTALIAERLGTSVALGACALLLAFGAGIPAGTWIGARGRGPGATLARLVSIAALSLHPLVLSLLLLLFAARTGWFPLGAGASSADTSPLTRLHALMLPALALAIPVGASIERIQADAIRRALAEPSLRAARARGIGEPALLWRHAMRLALPPLLSTTGLIAGAVLSGSFVVEIVMSVPGLGALMYEALMARDLFLVAGCAAAAAALLAVSILASDTALAMIDPRLEDLA